MRPQVTIELDHYDQLVEDSSAFQNLKDNKSFIHLTVWETIGGRRTTVLSNDTRVEEIKKASMRELESIVTHKNHQINKLQEEIKELKAMGFFKRLFS